MKAYKGFNVDMTCKGFQYEEGEEYEEENASLCVCGFHACLNPLDVFRYYNPLTSIYHEVDLDGHVSQYDADGRGFDSKLCATKIKIGPAIEVSDMIEKSIEYMSNNLSEADVSDSTNVVTAISTNKSKHSNADSFDIVVCNSGMFSLSATHNPDNIAVNTGLCSIAAVHCEGSISVVNGSHSASVSIKRASIAVSNGERSITENYGDCSMSVQMGADSIADSTGLESISINRGDYGKAQTSGINSSAIAAGSYSEAVVKEKGSIACALGYKCMAKGCVGSWLLLAEWEPSCRGYERGGVALFYVDGEKVKADTFYKLSGGELVEAISTLFIG